MPRFVSSAKNRGIKPLLQFKPPEFWTVASVPQAFTLASAREAKRLG
jgi:hypothetical protein